MEGRAEPQRRAGSEVHRPEPELEVVDKAAAAGAGEQAEVGELEDWGDDDDRRKPGALERRRIGDDERGEAERDAGDVEDHRAQDEVAEPPARDRVIVGVDLDTQMTPGPGRRRRGQRGHGSAPGVLDVGMWMPRRWGGGQRGHGSAPGVLDVGMWMPRR